MDWSTKSTNDSSANVVFNAVAYGIRSVHGFCKSCAKRVGWTFEVHKYTTPSAAREAALAASPIRSRMRLERRGKGAGAEFASSVSVL